jgi:inositol oxygenase
VGKKSNFFFSLKRTRFSFSKKTLHFLFLILKKKMRVINKNLSDAAKVTEAWETFLHDKYSNKKETETFRDYTKADDEQPTVTAFYKENHEKQSLQHVLDKKKLYEGLTHGEMGIWEALEVMNGLVDESDPDTSLSQIAHALQSAEAARRDGQPRWMILTALIHDLGKYLFFLGEPQWTVKYTYIPSLRISHLLIMTLYLGCWRHFPCWLPVL